MGGVTVEELNFLERETLLYVGYNLAVDSDTYIQYLNDVLLRSMPPPETQPIEYTAREPPDMKANTENNIERVKTAPSTTEMDITQQ